MVATNPACHVVCLLPLLPVEPIHNILIGFVLRALYWNSGLSLIISNNLIKGAMVAQVVEVPFGTSADSSPALSDPIKVSLSKIRVAAGP